MRYVHGMRYWHWNWAGYVNGVMFGDDKWNWLRHWNGNGTLYFNRYGMRHRYGDFTSDGNRLRYGHCNWDHAIHDGFVNVVYGSVSVSVSVSKTWCVYSVNMSVSKTWSVYSVTVWHF